MNKPHHIKFLVARMIFLALLMVPIYEALASSYQLPITRDGQTKKRVAINNWMGEYPQPVISINPKKRGYTTIKAYKSLRKLNQIVSCTIKNGIYHPWSKIANSMIDYYTITEIVSYKALKKARLDKIPVAKGTIIDNIHGLSEGYCSGRLKSGSMKRIEFYCDDINNPAFQKIKSGRRFHEQWLYLKCHQGYNAFVQDSQILKQPGVSQGKIKGYGNVAP
jgi:hypothetical protein